MTASPRSISATVAELSNTWESYRARKTTQKSHPVHALVVDEIPAILESWTPNSDKYKFDGSDGKGNILRTPWFAVLNLDVTDSATKGYYLVYLLSADLIRESLISTASGAAINLILNFMLIPRLGALGAAVATVVSYGIAGWLILYTRRSTRHVAIMMSKSFLPVFRLAEYSKNIRQFFSQH